MSQLKEILEKEKERGSLEQCAVIHLFPLVRSDLQSDRI